MNIEKTGAGENPLDRNASMLADEETQDLDFLLGLRCKTDMAALGRHDALAAAARDDQRLTQSGPGAEKQDRRADRRYAGLYADEVRPIQSSHAIGERFEIVDDNEAIEAEPAPRRLDIERPCGIREFDYVIRNRTSDGEACRRRPGARSIQESARSVRDGRKMFRTKRACLTDLWARRWLNQRKARISAPDVGDQRGAQAFISCSMGHIRWVKASSTPTDRDAA